MQLDCSLVVVAEKDNLIAQLCPEGEQSRWHNKPTLCNAVVGTWSGYTNGYGWKLFQGRPLMCLYG